MPIFVLRFPINGEICCGAYDCKSYSRASSTASGWMIDGELSAELSGRSVSHHHGIQVVTMRALKSAPIIARFFVRFDPRKPHGRATLRTSPITDPKNWWEINF
jgi:hypothetical protein